MPPLTAPAPSDRPVSFAMTTSTTMLVERSGCSDRMNNNLWRTRPRSFWGISVAEAAIPEGSATVGKEDQPSAMGEAFDAACKGLRDTG